MSGRVMSRHRFFVPATFLSDEQCAETAVISRFLSHMHGPGTHTGKGPKEAHFLAAGAMMAAQISSGSWKSAIRSASG